MPLYEFMCERTEEIFEQIMLISEADIKFIPCPIHPLTRNVFGEHNAERIWSVPVVRFDAKPTIIFRNPRTGETQVATRDNELPPHGYIRQELRGPIERSKFEREETEKKYVEDELTTEKLKQGREQTAKNIRDDINARMNSVTNKVYNPETKQEENVVWDEQTKGMLKRSMEYGRKKHAKIKPKRTQVRLEVNHTDSSNLIK